MISPDLIGREDELARLGRVLAANEPAAVIVCGPAGIGRHALIDGACRKADGWKRMPPTGLGLYVEPRTTPDGFVQRLRTAIGAPPGAGAEDATDPRPVAALLAALAPVALVLERYRPHRGMDRWVADALMPALRDKGAAVVLAILDPPQEDTRVTATAAERIELGALEPDVVRPEIVQATRSVRPPLTDAELDVYVQGVAERPGILDSLLRLLAVPVGEADATADASAS